MRLLKGFIITVLGFFIVITLVSLLMPSDVITTRTINMSAKPEVIMHQVSDINEWKNWHPLFLSGEVQPRTNTKPGTAEWISNRKSNRLTITSAGTNEVRFIFARDGENEQQNKITVLHFNNSDNLQVEWSAHTKLKWYPWEKFSGMFLDKMTGPGYEAALASLKNEVENIKPGN